MIVRSASYYWYRINCEQIFFLPIYSELLIDERFLNYTTVQSRLNVKVKLVVCLLETVEGHTSSRNIENKMREVNDGHQKW